MRATASLLLCLLLAAAAPAARGGSDDTLEIYVIDVERGEATLFVAPADERPVLRPAAPYRRGLVE